MKAAESLEVYTQWNTPEAAPDNPNLQKVVDSIQKQDPNAALSLGTLAGYFAEHSTPERYLAGNVALLRNPGLLADPPGPLVGVDPGAAIAAGARVTAPCRIAAGATVEAGAEVGPDVVLGAGARGAAGARIQRAVVWPGATVTGDVASAVVMPDATVAVG